MELYRKIQWISWFKHFCRVGTRVCPIATHLITYNNNIVNIFLLFFNNPHYIFFTGPPWIRVFWNTVLVSPKHWCVAQITLLFEENLFLRKHFDVYHNKFYKKFSVSILTKIRGNQFEDNLLFPIQIVNFFLTFSWAMMDVDVSHACSFFSIFSN